MAEAYDPATEAVATEETPAETPLANSVYVGNLPWGVTDEELAEHMSGAGPVAKASVMRYPDGRSKGCATVQYVNVADAANAIATLTDTMVGDRKVFVREDREGPSGAPKGRARATGGGGGGGGGGAGGGRRRRREGGPPASSADPDAPAGAPGTALFIGNLAWKTSKETLDELFTAYGAVYANIKTDNSGRSKGYGIVRCADAAQATQAITDLNGTELDGRIIEVREDRMA